MTHPEQFFSRFKVWLVKIWTTESRQDTAVTAAMLCLTVCVRDVMSTMDVCGISVDYVKSQPFFFFGSVSSLV